MAAGGARVDLREGLVALTAATATGEPLKYGEIRCLALCLRQRLLDQYKVQWPGQELKNGYWLQLLVNRSLSGQSLPWALYLLPALFLRLEKHGEGGIDDLLVTLPDLENIPGRISRLTIWGFHPLPREEEGLPRTMFVASSALKL